MYTLDMQTDGNLVVYFDDKRSPRRPIWASQTVRRGFEFIMQEDGDAVVTGWHSFPAWRSRTNGTGAEVVIMQDDGSLVIYDANMNPKWNSKRTCYFLFIYSL